MSGYATNCMDSDYDDGSGIEDRCEDAGGYADDNMNIR